MADLEYTVADGIGTILLNRPHRKNAFTIEMIDQWARILVEARTDPDVRVIVLTGAGDAFCSGVDLSSMDGERPSPLQRKEHLTDHIHRIPYALEDLDKPVIAAINGAAVGAGMDMALMCDMRIIARSAGYQRSTRCSRPGGGSYGSGQKSVTRVISPSVNSKNAIASSVRPSRSHSNHTTARCSSAIVSFRRRCQSPGNS